MLHGHVNTNNCRIFSTPNPSEYTQKPIHSPKVIVWCVHRFFHHRTLLLLNTIPIKWVGNNSAEYAVSHLMLLPKKVPCLFLRDAAPASVLWKMEYLVALILRSRHYRHRCSRKTKTLKGVGGSHGLIWLWQTSAYIWNHGCIYPVHPFCQKWKILYNSKIFYCS